MSHRFFRCKFCGLPHDVGTPVCPVTGQAIVRSRDGAPSDPPPASRAAAAQGSRPPATPRTRSDQPPAPPPQAWMGRVIDQRYRIESVIAQGGMGVVYRATHLQLQRPVALKALSRKHAEDPVAIARFRNEARLAGSLGHPNIVEVYDMGTLDDGSPYLVMELLTGETLSDYMKREQMVSVPKVGIIIEQVLSALEATHAHGVVHRDLKPENVLLAEKRDGSGRHVKLLDFGISKAVRSFGDESDTGLTRMGFIMGTPSCMAPEQARGDRNLDERVDLYAVGVLAYQLLLARLPYTSRTLAALVAEMAKTQPVRIRTVRADVNERLEAVVMKLLSISRSERYRTAKETLQVWRAALAPRRPSVQMAALTGPMQPAKDAPPLDDPEPTEVSGPPRVLGKADPDASQRVQVFALPKPPRPS